LLGEKELPDWAKCAKEKGRDKSKRAWREGKGLRPSLPWRNEPSRDMGPAAPRPKSWASSDD